MKRVKVTLLINVDKAISNDEDVIMKWLGNQIDGMTHESFDYSETKLGELDVKVVGVEIDDV